MKVVGEARPLQAVDDRDHVRGPSNASITVVHYGDFECPFSREGSRVMNVLEGRFDGRLRIVFRHFPLTTKHPHAQQAVEAAEAAAAQGRFWEMAEFLFANQHKLADLYLTRYAIGLGMDTSKFDYDLATHAYAERIRADVLSGKQNGVTGTPTFFINGRRHEGSDDLPSLMAAMRLTPAQGVTVMRVVGPGNAIAKIVRHIFSPDRNTLTEGPSREEIAHVSEEA